MLDGITLYNIPLDAVTNSDVLEFKPRGDRREDSRYNGLILSRNEDACRLRGSIHKYSNGGRHNYDDFPLSRFIHTLDDLCRTINIEPQAVNLSGFEMGVNIDVENVDKVLNSVLLLNNTEPTRKKGYIKFEFADYAIKIYSKELEGYKPKLRFELAVKSKRKKSSIISNFIKKYKLSSLDYISCNRLSDLTNSNIWLIFADELMDIYNNILIADIDSIDTSKLRKKESEIITKGTKPNYWNAENWNSRATRNRHLKKFEETISKHSSKLKEEIRAKISTKIGKLIDVETKATYEPNFSVLINGNEKIDFLIPTYSKRDTGNNKNETNVAFGEKVEEYNNVTNKEVGKVKEDSKNETILPFGGKTEGHNNIENIAFEEAQENSKNETNVAVDKNDKRFISVNLEERTYPIRGESLNKQNAPTKIRGKPPDKLNISKQQVINI